MESLPGQRRPSLSLPWLVAGFVLWSGACNEERLDADGGTAADLATSDRAHPVADGPRRDQSEQPPEQGPARDSTVNPCSKCHGGPAGPAPPLSLNGKSSTSERGVGAHASHLKSSTWRAKVACAACHVVPKALGDKGHIDTGAPAEVVFSGMARLKGLKPVWDGVRCSGTYCHGASLSFGQVSAPRWTKVDGTQASCGACHGLPPMVKHPQSKACWKCHKAVVGANGQIIAPQLHIDGKVSLSLGP